MKGFACVIPKRGRTTLTLTAYKISVLFSNNMQLESTDTSGKLTES